MDDDDEEEDGDESVSSFRLLAVRCGETVWEVCDEHEPTRVLGRTAPSERAYPRRKSPFGASLLACSLSPWKKKTNEREREREREREL